MVARKPYDERYHSAREHLAGLKAAARLQEELSAAGLLRTEDPISRRPVEAEEENAK